MYEGVEGPRRELKKNNLEFKVRIQMDFEFDV